MPETIRLEGRFTVKEGDERQPFLVFESERGMSVHFPLNDGTTLYEAMDLARQLNRQISAVVVTLAQSGR